MPKKNKWKIYLAIAAILISSLSVQYTRRLVKKLSIEERKKVKLWAQATKQLEENNLSKDLNVLVFTILQDNTTIPVILTNDKDSIITYSNIDKEISKNGKKLIKKLKSFKSAHLPIIVEVGEGRKNYIYYGDSILKTLLYYYPYVQIFILFLYGWVAYAAFSASRNAEQTRVWIGMSRETAHQLGTPISSLVAAVEYLRIKNVAPVLVDEIEKDAERLNKIAKRFSKIGSEPTLEPVNIYSVINNSISYLRTRTSQRIHYYENYNKNGLLIIDLNETLFEWIIENLCKNAIDAMEGEGAIYISIFESSNHIQIEIKDTGKGIPKSRFKTVFQPGYSTKKRGWGLGLSLTKRIVENYHNGKIIVKESDRHGTTFRIEIPKQQKIL